MPIFFTLLEDSVKNISIFIFDTSHSRSMLIFESSFENKKPLSYNHSFSISFALDKLPSKDNSIFPSILSLALRMSLEIATLIDITIGEGLLAKPMFKEIQELPFILLASLHSMNPIASDFPIPPLAHISLIFLGLPVAWAMFLAIFPLARVILAMGPEVLALALPLAIVECSLVLSRRCSLNPLYLKIALPNPLEPIPLLDKYPGPWFLERGGSLPEVQAGGARVMEDLETGGFYQVLHYQHIWALRGVAFYQWSYLLLCLRDLG